MFFNFIFHLNSFEIFFKDHKYALVNNVYIFWKEDEASKILIHFIFLHIYILEYIDATNVKSY